MRNFDEENKDGSSSSKKNSKERIASGSSNSMKDGSGSKDLCGDTAEKKDQENGETKSKDITFIVLQKT